VGQIVAGVVCRTQPSRLDRSQRHTHALSDLGVMFLMFDVGLQVKANELMRIGGKAALVETWQNALKIGLGWVPGARSGWWWPRWDSEGDQPGSVCSSGVYGRRPLC